MLALAEEAGAFPEGTERRRSDARLRAETVAEDGAEAGRHGPEADAGNEGAGTRTLDQRIKSPLLYQLSYALAWDGGAVARERRSRRRLGECPSRDL